MRNLIVAALLGAAVSLPAMAQDSTRWFMAEAGTCREVQTPSERVQSLRRAGERAARAIPYRPEGAAADSEPTRFTVQRGSGQQEIFFRFREDCLAGRGQAHAQQPSEADEDAAPWVAQGRTLSNGMTYCEMAQGRPRPGRSMGAFWLEETNHITLSIIRDNWQLPRDANIRAAIRVGAFEETISGVTTGTRMLGLHVRGVRAMDLLTAFMGSEGGNLRVELAPEYGVRPLEVRLANSTQAAFLFLRCASLANERAGVSRPFE